LDGAEQHFRRLQANIAGARAVLEVHRVQVERGLPGREPAPQSHAPSRPKRQDLPFHHR
jgi:hypothetical protein